MATSNKKRIEKDSLGTMELPADVYYGLYTQRVLGNFPVSGQKVPELLIRNYILVKAAYAKVHKKVKKMDAKQADAIVYASEKLLKLNSAEFMKHFPIDSYQSGGGTSTNMMVNEVIANFANEILGKPKGSYQPVHPNDHINMSQSSNDTFPGVTKITCVLQLDGLIKEIEITAKLFEKKAKEFSSFDKVGRTHLQDALKIKAGDEFSAYAATMNKNKRFLMEVKNFILELPFGGTAVGSMQNVTLAIRKEIIAQLSRDFGQKFRQPLDYFEGTSSSGDVNKLSGSLSSLAADIVKICSDIRLLVSGPRAGLNELSIPAVQAGSSIMPGKVNPSIPEAMMMICFRVMGNTRTIELATVHSQLELQAFMPIIAIPMHESFEILINGLKMFREKCLMGLTANREEMIRHLDNSFVYATEYMEELGYAKVAELVKKAYAENKNLRDLINEELKK